MDNLTHSKYPGMANIPGSVTGLILDIPYQGTGGGGGGGGFGRNKNDGWVGSDAMQKDMGCKVVGVRVYEIGFDEWGEGGEGEMDYHKVE